MAELNRVAAITLGCKVNQYETEGMLEMLKAEGFEIVDPESVADIYIVNTCSVTNMADRKSRQMIHRAKKINPDAIVVACGCYVQAKADELKDDLSIDILIGNNKKKEIVEAIKEFTQGAKVCSCIDIGKDNEYENISITDSGEHTRAYVKIQDGCNQFCTYCIIPYVRGRIRSRELSDVIDEITKLGANGIKEVVLTGIHVSSYGKDKENGIYLIDLIEAISKIQSIKRIRLSSLEPGIITEDFVKRISAIKKVCPHFHLSLQSGCDTVLSRMNRKYNTKDYFEKCDMLRKAYDRPALTTDVIVGFPGETEEEFAITKNYLEELNLYEMHIFKYSPRQGTVAAKMNDQIHPDVKSERSDVLLEMTSRHKEAYEKGFVGSELEVLVEEVVTKDGKTYLRGHTERYMEMFISADGIECPESFVNSFVYVSYDEEGCFLL